MLRIEIAIERELAAYRFRLTHGDDRALVAAVRRVVEPGGVIRAELLD